MAGALGGLFISLGLDSAEFTAGLSKAQHEGRRALQRIKQDAEDMGKAFALGAVAAGAAATLFARNVINAAADLDDMAEKTGASVEELSKLTQQAHISGTAIETVEQTLIQLSKHLQGAGEDSKNTGRALAALGLKAEDLKRLDTAEAMKVIANELNRFADGSGKSALAMDLLGKAGAQALPFLKDMANDQALAANVTAKQAAEAEELGKAWRRLTLDAKNLGQSLALDIVPWLKDLIEQFREGIKIAGGFGEALRLFGLSSITQSNAGEKIKGIRDELERLQAILANPPKGAGTQMLARVQSQADDLKKQLEFAKLLQRQTVDFSAGDTPGELQRFGLKGAKQALDYKSLPGDDAKKKLEDIKKLQEEVVRLGASIDVSILPLTRDDLADLDKTKARLEGTKKTLEEGRKGWIAYAEAVFANADAENTAAGSGESFTQISERLTEQVKALIDPTYELAKANKALDAAFADGSLRVSEYQLRLAKLDPEIRSLLQSQSTNIYDKIQKAWEAGNLEVDEMNRLLLDLQPKLEKDDDLVKELGLTFTSAFEDAIAGGKKLSDILKALEKDILKIVTRKLITEPIGTSITDALKGASGNGGGGFGGLIGGIFEKVFGGGSKYTGGSGWSGDAEMQLTSGGAEDFYGNLIASVAPPVDVGTPYVQQSGLAYIHRGERVMTAADNKNFSQGHMRSINYAPVFHFAGPVDRRAPQQVGAAAYEGARRAFARNR